MKILVQNSETQRYLSAGRWVRSAADAADFEAILRAYRFAKEHTSGHFQVVLYCPEDEYVTNIIGGIGVAPCEVFAAADAVQLPVYSLDAQGEMWATLADRTPQAVRSMAFSSHASRFQLN